MQKVEVAIHRINAQINSKTGTYLKPQHWRDVSKWREFERLLQDAAASLGLSVFSLFDHPERRWPLSRALNVLAHGLKAYQPPFDLFYMQMHMADVFTLDSNGWGCDGTLPSEWNEEPLEKRDYELLELAERRRVTKHHQPSSSAPIPIQSDSRDPLIFCPLQTPRDHVILNHSAVSVPAFIKTIMSVAQTSRSHFVFKKHPYSKNDNEINQNLRLTEKLENVYVVDANVIDLIDNCQGVVAINSGVGFESLVRRKPVYLYGDADYSPICQTQSTTPLEEFVKDPKQFLDEDMRRQFLSFYLSRHAFFLEDDRRLLINRMREKIIRALDSSYII